MRKCDFNLKEYIRDSKQIDNYLKPKLRYFLMYLQETLGDDILFDVDMFSLVDGSYLINSLEYYIDRTSPSKQTALDYRRAVVKLLELICVDYNLENELLTIVAKQNDFTAAANTIIQHLREQENRKCISDAEFEAIDEKINDFFATDNLENLIVKSIENEHMKPNYYGQLVSAIALKLVWKYALGNTVIAGLTIQNLNMEHRILNVKGIKLHLDEELISYFELYLKCRSLVTSRTIESTILFVKKNGTPYLDTNDQPDNNGLFLLMQSAVNHKKVGGFRDRTIIDLVLRGANINLLSQLSDTKEETIKRICQGYEEELKQSFENILSVGYALKINGFPKSQKGLMQCPFCGRFTDACSTNWILIQVQGEGKKYLACRECRGQDGEYKY